MVGHEAPIPPNEQALELSVERLAMLLRRAVNEHHSICNRHNVTLPDAWREHYAEPRGRELLAAISEAFSWLERQGLVAPDPGQSGKWMIVTRRGKELLADDDALGNLLASSRLALASRVGRGVRCLHPPARPGVRPLTKRLPAYLRPRPRRALIALQPRRKHGEAVLPRGTRGARAGDALRRGVLALTAPTADAAARGSSERVFGFQRGAQPRR